MGLIQSNWCFPKKRRLGRLERHHGWLVVHARRDDHVKGQREGGCLRAKERGLRKNQAFGHLDLGLPASYSVRR